MSNIFDPHKRAKEQGSISRQGELCMEKVTESTKTTPLPTDTHIGQVTLGISQLQRSLAFYTEVLGFKVVHQSAQTAILGAEAGMPLLTLLQQEQAKPQPAYSTGLYHFAILVPSQAALGRSLQHLADSHYALDGYADHLVSEALYLSDPDGNGIEIYRDRPRSEWPMRNGQVAMASDPPDFKAILAAANNEGLAWTGLQPQTCIGHIHLRVGDLRVAEQFYHGILGFDVMAQMPGALFVSAGGYHHHIGLNTWQSRGAPQPPQDAVGLRCFSIRLPGLEDVARVKSRLQTASMLVSEQQGAQPFLALRDPWGNAILLLAGDEPQPAEVREVLLSLA